MPHLLLFAFLLAAFFLQAQNPDQARTNRWYFGDGAGLDFSSGTAVADTSGKLSVLEGCATMSDLNGNLLMYTDGKTVYNALHDTMENGTDIGVGKYATPRDGTIIIPKPFDDNIYYIFTVDGWENQFDRGMRYTTVDMTYNGGLGKVIEKNHLLFSPATEQLAATRDGDGCGYWVVSHERSNANWRAYHVTSAGVDTVPVISAAGQDYGVMQQVYILNGGYGFRFSPNGTKAIAANYWNYAINDIPEQMQLLHFNKSQGSFQYILTVIADSSVGGYGFSPDNSKMYIETGYYSTHIKQYEITSWDTLAIINSEQVVYESGYNLFLSQDMKIGKDEKIYLCAEYVVSDSLSTIDYPNETGSACNVKRATVWLQGRQPTQCLPNFVFTFAVDSEIICQHESISEAFNNEINISPNPASNYISIEAGNAFFPMECSIFDATGRLHLAFVVYRNNGKLNIEQLNNGIYLIQIKMHSHFLNQKLIVSE